MISPGAFLYFFFEKKNTTLKIWAIRSKLHQTCNCYKSFPACFKMSYTFQVGFLWKLTNKNILWNKIIIESMLLI